MSKTTEKKTHKEKIAEASIPKDIAADTSQLNDAPEAQPVGLESSEDAAARPPEETDAATGPTPEDALEARSAECEQLKDQLLRVRADFDNYRKRLLREMEQLRQNASLRLIQNLLPALDNLERALAHAKADDGFVEGVTMVYKQFQEILGAEGLEPIPAVGEQFDPNIHDALAAMPSETIASGRVLEEYERGYRLRHVVVRPARVIVSSGAPSNGEAQASSEPEQEIIETTESVKEDTPSNA